jgi:hypothetical protein
MFNNTNDQYHWVSGLQWAAVIHHGQNPLGSTKTIHRTTTAVRTRHLRWGEYMYLLTHEHRQHSTHGETSIYRFCRGS